MKECKCKICGNECNNKYRSYSIMDNMTKQITYICADCLSKELINMKHWFSNDNIDNPDDTSIDFIVFRTKTDLINYIKSSTPEGFKIYLNIKDNTSSIINASKDKTNWYIRGCVSEDITFLNFDNWEDHVHDYDNSQSTQPITTDNKDDNIDETLKDIPEETLKNLSNNNEVKVVIQDNHIFSKNDRIYDSNIFKESLMNYFYNSPMIFDNGYEPFEFSLNENCNIRALVNPTIDKNGDTIVNIKDLKVISSDYNPETAHRYMLIK